MKCPGKRRKNIQILNGYLTSPRQDQTNKETIRLAEAIKLQYWLSRSRSDGTSQSRRIDSRNKDTEKLPSRVTHTKTMSQTPQAHSLTSIWLWWEERKGLGLKLKTPGQRKKPIRNVCNYDVYSWLNRFGNHFDNDIVWAPKNITHRNTRDVWNTRNRWARLVHDMKTVTKTDRKIVWFRRRMREREREREHKPL